MKARRVRVVRPWILALAFFAATPASSAADSGIRTAIGKSISLLQQTGKTWYEKQGCASCHHQDLPMMVFGLARQRAVPVDTPMLQEAVHKVFAAFASLDRAVQNTHLFDPAMDTGYWLLGAEAIGVPRSITTSVYARLLARRQEEDGGWATPDMRPPQSYSRFTATAVAMRGMQFYAPQQMSGEIHERIERAKAWLSRMPPQDTEDRAFQMFGLHWAGANPSELKNAADALLSEQQPDGGWRQLPGRFSDAYATGEALVALHMAAGLSTGSEAYQRGMRYLLSSQLPDGSWLVKTRLPDQRSISPAYFETGFPHKEHQIISCMGTTWASMALLYALPVRTARAPVLNFSRLTPATPQDWMEAALFESVAELQPLLDRGLDPNSTTAEGTSALMMASADLDKVKLLVARGADVNARSQSGFSALMTAASYHGTTEVVRALLNKGAEARTPAGIRVLFHANPVVYAASSGEAEKISLLAAKGADVTKPMLLIGQFGTTPLTMASQQGETAVAEALIHHGAAVDEQDSDGITALGWAALGNRTRTVEALVKLGATVNHVDKYGLTPLLHAVQTYFGDTRTVEILLQAGADVKARTPEGSTALDLAARYGYPEIHAVLERAATKVAGL